MMKKSFKNEFKLNCLNIFLLFIFRISIFKLCKYVNGSVWNMESAFHTQISMFFW